MKQNDKNTGLILAKLDLIEEKLIQQHEAEISDFISEHEAKQLFKRGTTWFWNLRRCGFPFTKLGGEVYYQKKDMLKYFKDNLKARD
jgi:hypothetical protein